MTQQNELQVMDTSGHFTTKWDPDNRDEVKAAKDMFDTLVGEKGYTAFRVELQEGKGERIKTFDPKAGKIIMVPQLVGG